MLENTWGLLGSEFLSNSRRTRTLGLGAAVRLFNDLAVPGLGGVWYGKQLLLATLGVAVAERARNKGAKVQNIEVANAIEALACWLAFRENNWKSDPRLRGNTKLQGKDDDFSFARVRQRNFYVTQPMRMATVQALPALGLADADGARFNAFRCTDAGTVFIEEACRAYRPYNRSVIDHLVQWVLGQDRRADTDALRNALSPLTSLSTDTLPLLSERLFQGGIEESEDKLRRRNALAWVEGVRQKPDKNGWDAKPQCIDERHWHDLVAGAKLFSTRDAAIAVLDALEAHIGNKTQGMSHSLHTAVPDTLLPLFTSLQTAAQAFLDTKHADENATAFCRECAKDDASAVLRSLVVRDGHVLRLVGELVKPGPAFRGSALTNIEAGGNGEDLPVTKGIPLPEGISYRMRNLYLLNLDLHGDLNQWLNPIADGVKQ
ncbi:hypothetical protein R82526_01286 [Ralstonia mannitolilytica]|uniref:hypothetical protein n=1 Tax=Ralstonia mannitolilytica TaxID=105219 RepID=UPI0028F56467|nr:hypothetical protein [Ralstonia mannitolilytica]CAJ0681551.1 hypothetical protein R82526_01286 [Ralstonia mannitolilytica]